MNTKAGSNKGEDRPPYPGLRHYEDSEALFFAGREEDAKRCTSLLGKTPVVILHGRSGCGKSSFLRAGVKPMMSEAMPGRTFPENFEVVRCTEDPLKAFSDMLGRVCDDFVSNWKKGFWKAKGAVKTEDIDQFAKSYRARVGMMGKSARKTCQTLEELCRLLKSVPVFVIDQAEEVFTHEEKKKRELAKLIKLDPSAGNETDEIERKELEGRIDELKEATKEFFKLLTLVANDGAGGAKLVISLRTEYKGQFDDRIKYNKRTLDKFQGFYLEDLDVRGLKSAIERPTLKTGEWGEVAGADEESAPFDKWRFEFGNGVAEQLAKMLINTGKVPEGGVLPTLQIACLRLWDQAVKSNRKRRGSFVIEDRHLKKIGRIDTQVQEYISQKLQKACQNAGKWSDGKVDAVEEWQSILNRKLVEVQADGRAVTVTIPREELLQHAIEQFGFQKEDTGGRKKIDIVIDYLLEPGVALLNDSLKDGMLALGHDSVALSLNRWSIRSNLDDRMMKRMKMTGLKEPQDYTMADLFPMVKRRGKKAVRDEPHRTKIIIHDDPHWDRQFPHFADAYGFANRLGIELVTDRKDLDLAAKGTAGAPKDWADLSQKLRDEERKTHGIRTNRRKDRRENVRVMVASDWHSFPRVATGELEDNDEALRRENESIVPRWTDVVVTNLFTGNGLIGSHLPGVQSLSHEFVLSKSHPGEQYLPIMEENLRVLVDHEGEVRCHDNLSREFLIKSAELVCGKGRKIANYIRKEENVSVFVSDETDNSLYPLADWFIDGSDAERPRFIVGTAATRALAQQADGHLYFATSHLTLAARWMINQRRKESGDEVTEDEGDINSEVQKVIKHTSWQLGIAPAQWNQGRNRALVLRLASIGYYTSEYYRSHTEKFVLFILGKINDQFAAEDGSSNSRGARMNRDSLRDAVRDCYSVLRFDEVGTEFYDLDSTVAYLTNHAKYESLSAAGEIYRELASLRQQTLVHYESVSRMIAWLRKWGGYRLSEDVTKQVTELKECAWNNYRIFNFFDSARYMTEASLLLQREMESVEHGNVVVE